MNGLSVSMGELSPPSPQDREPDRKFKRWMIVARTRWNLLKEARQLAIKIGVKGPLSRPKT